MIAQATTPRPVSGVSMSLQDLRSTLDVFTLNLDTLTEKLNPVLAQEVPPTTAAGQGAIPIPPCECALHDALQGILFGLRSKIIQLEDLTARIKL